MHAPTPIARARTDGRDWLIEADEPLATLQIGTGGQLPGPIMAPALLEIVRRSRKFGLKLARLVRAQGDAEKIAAWVQVEPDEAGDGCSLQMFNWKTAPLDDQDAKQALKWRWDIARRHSGLSLRLGPGQEILAVEAHEPELNGLADRMTDHRGRHWSEFARGEAQANRHWRLIDGASVVLAGSDRSWRAHMIPLGSPDPGSAGFELHFVSEAAREEQRVPPNRVRPASDISGEIAHVLRQPVARIIANAETIRTQLAGPLAEEYSNYASDISTAGEHLLSLLDDLADLEVVEDEEFVTAPDRIDLADLARRAAGILAMRARERQIAIDVPKADERVPAIGEFRRVLQILLNLLGNAIRYSPLQSQIWLRVEAAGDRAYLIVADQGEGLSEEQQGKLFEKFERLGRKGDGGSGLGLYISRRLARAMDGELSVESAPGQGARFILDLPADPNAESAN